MNATGAYVEVTGCNGTLSTNVENTHCTVLMSTLRDELGLLSEYPGEGQSNQLDWKRA